MGPSDWAKRALELVGLSENSPRLEKLTKVIEEAMADQRELDAKLSEWWETYKGPQMESLPWVIRNNPLGKPNDPTRRPSN